ncbi:MAG: class I SAM-dependent methyltransferase [Planctomycetales bacterium]|nr:class I SAM-dependent methyltransferase [Planctomycetales bacterium]
MATGSDKTRTAVGPLYGEDLANIHCDGYGFHWSGAADAILEWFTHQGVTRGTVVDLGCGGGQWAQRLTEEGYTACGVDVSPAMIRLAKHNAPRARFLCGSFDRTALPACDAVTSLGEPLNYLDGAAAARRTLRGAYRALRPGGLLVFDLRLPSSSPVPPKDHFKHAADWFCHARIEEDHRKKQLTRFITTFRRMPDGRFRRDEEFHRLKLFSRAEVCRWLRELGFRVQTRQSYGAYQLLDRQSAFFCRKP